MNTGLEIIIEPDASTAKVTTYSYQVKVDGLVVDAGEFEDQDKFLEETFARGLRGLAWSVLMDWIIDSTSTVHFPGRE